MAKLVHDVQKKQHRERSQITSRTRYGFLEKHKDYVKRAQDFHRKQSSLKILREKVKERNPDEYYHAMHSRKTDAKGLLITSRHGDDEDESLSMDQVKLLKTQDSNYVRTLRQLELKKLEKRSKELMFKSSGNHTIFVDSREKMEDFAPETFFNTTSEMVNRSENRLTKDQLTQDVLNNKSASSIMPKESLDKKKLKKFKQVKQHIQRETQLKQVQQRMDAQRELLKKGSKKKIVDSSGKSSFKWKKQRKR
ncbi:hypothetical protein SEUBUCD646_0K01220 [Saccharomyces eubayanus]|uniref:U3 small nucleolar RNA-associated protein 11 n=2 Tax=Saccharomyces TaxID=4930 RepID=A0A6C1EB48_SACPS|nr:UTP11-like protein [Saccharomyces eubayanus]KOG98226.1 UTP11-like protein [Saccharomyces eubayanus]QID86355.1 Small subunit (SSU) processome component [Saccharomyces pastorianus]CAI1539891.1 hypothetical protein SEUBUCD650_0K01240 [Saccharomyces eubayanus]CAI1561703.1 hypothetical protein SEUBUCD646_0K01220 [Saccharomyces eubayanus]